MDQTLVGRRVAILVMNNFEEAELTGPKKGLEDAGARVVIASAKSGQVTAMKHDEKSAKFQVDKIFAELDACDYDAVMLPGGVFNADTIRSESAAQQFVQDMAALNKPIGVICHGSWLLISAGLMKGRTLTSWPSLKDDLKNAGASWVDREVVVDGNLVSSRKPADIPAFNDKLIELMASSSAVQHA
jgi:protease I